MSHRFAVAVAVALVCIGCTSDEAADVEPSCDQPEVLVEQEYRFGEVDPGICAPNSMGLHIYRWDNTSITDMSPIVVLPGDQISVEINGYDPGSVIHRTWLSTPIPDGTFTADGTGTMSGVVTVPLDLSAGVHRAAFAGTNGGQPRAVEIFVEVEGRPAARDSYGIYFDGFVPFEEVSVTFDGLEWTSVDANQDGGTYVEVPVPDSTTPRVFEVVATGAETGEQTHAFTPAP